MSTDKPIALLLALLLTAAAVFLGWRVVSARPMPVPPTGAMPVSSRQLQDIYFGMGCFWGAEKRLRAPPPARPPAPHPPASPPPTTAPPATTPVINDAVAQRSPAPRYPQAALRRGVGGTVKVLANVAPDGSVAKVEVAEGSGNRDLDRAALDAVRRWQFKPATRNGQPVASEVRVPIVFSPVR